MAKSHQLLTAVAISLLTLSNSLSAQPNWEVIPTNYQYTMTLVGVAIIDCEESIDENDLVAAFVNGEVRGVQYLDTDFMGRKFAYMVIYDNEFSGSEITFKLYDASENEVRDAVGSIEFLENSNIGDVDAPYEVKTEWGIQDIFLTTDSIQHDATAGTVLSSIVAINENQDTISPTFAFVNDAHGPDNDYFSIMNNQLVLTEDVDASTKTSYQIHLTATNANGCSLDVVFVLPVAGVVSGLEGEQSVSDKHALMIYPNPATDWVHISTENNMGSVSIYNASGQLVKRIFDLNGKSGFDISGLIPAQYWVVFHSEQRILIQPLTIQH